MAKALVGPSFGPSTGPPHPGSRSHLREEHLTVFSRNEHHLRYRTEATARRVRHTSDTPTLDCSQTPLVDFRLALLPSFRASDIWHRRVWTYGDLQAANVERNLMRLE